MSYLILINNISYSQKIHIKNNEFPYKKVAQLNKIKRCQKIKVIEITNPSYNIGRYYNITHLNDTYIKLTYDETKNIFDLTFAETKYFSFKDSLFIDRIKEIEDYQILNEKTACLDCNELYILEIYKGVFGLKITKEFVTKIDW
ncbi:MAG: hypothetical protein EP305_04275 [Bacteroidetes bacterium]|nr:MAG: hypothetical protein EP305_04275 [Bacteroidota bacterium]